MNEKAAAGIVVPSLLRSTGYREQNLVFTLQRIRESGLTSVSALCQQVGGGAIDQTPYVEQHCPGLQVVTFKTEDQKIHKSRLVNLGVTAIRDRVKYIFQLDTDIHLPLTEICQQLAKLDPVEFPMVKPMNYFLRISIEQSDRVRSGENFQIRKSDFLPHQIVSYPGAGSIAFTPEIFDGIGGWDERMTGWGWEDVDFANRLMQAAAYKILPFVGFHLEHENDRLINKTNYELYTGRHGVEETWERMTVYVTKKFLLLSAGRCGSTMLARALRDHSEVHMYAAKDSIAKGTTELFNQHLVEGITAPWTWQTIMSRIGTELTAEAGSKTAGFKLILDQPSNAAYPHVSSVLLNANGWKYVYIFRRNLLEQICSRAYAMATKRWFQAYGSNPTAVVVDSTEAVNFIQRMLQDVCRVTRINRKRANAILFVSYEDLTLNWDQTIHDVLQHLGLKQEPLQNTTKRQREDTQTWDKLIENFAEVEALYRSCLPKWQCEFPEFFAL